MKTEVQKSNIKIKCLQQYDPIESRTIDVEVFVSIVTLISSIQKDAHHISIYTYDIWHQKPYKES